MKYIFILTSCIALLFLTFTVLAYAPANESKYLFWFQAYVFPAKPVEIMPDGTFKRGNVFPSYDYTGEWKVWDDTLSWVRIKGNFVDGCPDGNWKVYRYDGKTILSLTVKPVTTEIGSKFYETIDNKTLEKSFDFDSSDDFLENIFRVAKHSNSVITVSDIKLAPEIDD